MAWRGTATSRKLQPRHTSRSNTHIAEDVELIYSPLQQTYTADGETVDIQIYRSPDSGRTLEVVDKCGNSTVWDAEFETDQEALDQVMWEIKEDGIKALIGPEPEVTVH